MSFLLAVVLLIAFAVHSLVLVIVGGVVFLAYLLYWVITDPVGPERR